MRDWSAEFRRWAREDRPVHARLPLGDGLGVLVIRSLGGADFLTECPGCSSWMNIPQTRTAGQTIEQALYGPVSCPTCITDMVIHPTRVEVLVLGSMSQKRPVPPKKEKDREKRPRRPRLEVWMDDDSDL